MPRDNHPRERQARALARKKPKRPPFDRMLIVTEGTKTERNYLDEIRRQKRIPTAHIEVVPSEYGTEPRQIVDFAEDRFKETKAFDWVFAAFDRDDHRTYADALARALALDNALRNDEKKAVRFLAVPSVPCFELWLLLHFEDVWAFSHRTEVFAKLKARLPAYSKGASGLYALTESHCPAASQRAEKLRARFRPVPGDDPYTLMDELVARLRNIRA